MWAKKSRKVFKNNCAWCIFSPLEEWFYGIRIFQYRCHHRAPQNYQKTCISKHFILISVIFFLVGWYGLVYIWKQLLIETNVNSNNMKLLCCYFVTAILMIASIFTCSMKSKARLTEIKGLSKILENAKAFGLTNFFTHKEVSQLRKRMIIYRNVILGMLIGFLTIYLVQVYLKIVLSHIKWILVIGTSYFFHAVVFLFLSNLKVYQEAFKTNARRILQALKDRNYMKNKRSARSSKYYKRIEEDGLRQTLSLSIKLHGALYRNLLFFLDFWSFSVPALLLLLTAYVVLISTLLINDAYLFKTMPIPVLMDNMIMSAISVSPTISIVFIMRLADSLLEPVSNTYKSLFV